VFHAPERVTAGVEPHPQHPYDDCDAEENAQDLPAAAPEAQERGAARDEEQRRVGERQPGDPRLAQDFPVLEPDLGEEQRRPAEDRSHDRLFSVHRAPRPMVRRAGLRDWRRRQSRLLPCGA
jgi:hypothetical protein